MPIFCIAISDVVLLKLDKILILVFQNIIGIVLQAKYIAILKKQKAETMEWIQLDKIYQLLV